MDIIEKKIDVPFFSSEIYDSYFADMKTAVFDIETTGLNPEKDFFILAGFLLPGQGGHTVRQYFAASLSEEPDVVAAAVNEIKDLDAVVTYNGNSFDIPFTAVRTRRNNIPPATFPCSLDIYSLVRNYSPVKKFLPNLKQKTLEDFLGLWESREDRISGAESVSMYCEYLSRHDPDLKEKILLHNSDDVAQLYRLLKITEKTDFHKAMFYMGFPVRSGIWSGYIKDLKFSGDKLYISGVQRKNPLDYSCFGEEPDSFSCSFRHRSQTFSIHMLLHSEQKYIFADLRAADMDETPYCRYPFFENGCLILKTPDRINYQETNHFIKDFLERTIVKWII